MRKRGNVKKAVNKPLAFIVCILISCFTAFLGSLFTSSGVRSDWYESIKPALTPPNFIFPIVWTIIFFFIALSLYFAWISSFRGQRIAIVLAFGINLALNVMWSAFYFGMRNPMAAFVDIILLIISTATMIIYLWGIDRKASALLIPYLLWVCFAAVLNYMSAV